MLPLQGVGVLVTRPRQQAGPLCRLLEARGASAFPFPALEIKPLTDRRALAARLGALEDFDLIVFLSSNAVKFGAMLLDQKRDLPLAAIGPATSRALNQAGYRVPVQPAGGFDSENLLRHPRLEHLASNRILLVKGSGGREYLQDELSRRGAQVTIAEVYRRERATPSTADLSALEALFAEGAIQVITASSAETADNLLELAPASLRGDLERARWVVPSERVAARLRERGVCGTLLPADSAEDHDLVEAIVRWRAGESGA
ncbi:MAG: uroporphyrinogen-III synthase [Steroidobacteraceae bacterium]